MIHWTQKFLNIPYSERNCAEFAEMVLEKQFGIIFRFPQSEGSAFMQSHLIKENLPKFAYPEKTDHYEDGDLVLMNGKRRLSHVGIYANYRGSGYVLHNQKQHNYSRLNRLSDLSKCGLFLEGVYKWRK